MKRFFLFTILVLASLSVWASPCGKGKDHCFDSASWNPLSEKGTYFALGSGRNCNEALQDAEYRIIDEYPNLSCRNCNRDGQPRVRCGSNGGVYRMDQQCLRNKRTGTYYVWGQCDHFNSGYVPKDTRSRCTLIQGTMVCG